MVRLKYEGKLRLRWDELTELSRQGCGIGPGTDCLTEPRDMIEGTVEKREVILEYADSEGFPCITMCELGPPFTEICILSERMCLSSFETWS